MIKLASVWSIPSVEWRSIDAKLKLLWHIKVYAHLYKSEFISNKYINYYTRYIELFKSLIKIKQHLLFN
jgi:hypothetical protein